MVNEAREHVQSCLISRLLGFLRQSLNWLFLDWLSVNLNLWLRWFSVYLNLRLCLFLLWRFLNWLLDYSDRLDRLSDWSHWNGWLSKGLNLHLNRSYRLIHTQRSSSILSHGFDLLHWLLGRLRTVEDHIN